MPINWTVKITAEAMKRLNETLYHAWQTVEEAADVQGTYQRRVWSMDSVEHVRGGKVIIHAPPNLRDPRYPVYQNDKPDLCLCQMWRGDQYVEKYLIPDRVQGFCDMLIGDGFKYLNTDSPLLILTLPKADSKKKGIKSVRPKTK